MGKIDYAKVLSKIIEVHHHEIDKIEKIITDAKNDDDYYYGNVIIPFEKIVNDKEWTAEEKERLLRLFGYEKSEQELEYTNKYHNKDKMDAAKHMIKFNNLSGFTAYMNCFKDIEYHYVGIYITKDEAYKSILDSINAQKNVNVKKSEVLGIKQLTNEEEIAFMKAALAILSEEDKKRLCADTYEAHALTAVSNESIFINIIRTGNIDLIDEYVQYVDNISAYLSIAVGTGNIEVVQHFLDLGADINYYPKDVIYGLLTPLKRAINDNNYEMVQFLVDHGADVRLSVQEEDFIEKLHKPSLKIFDRWHKVHLSRSKETDKDVKDLQYLRVSTPLEYAITLKEYKSESIVNQYSITFEGHTCYITNSMDINTTPNSHTEEQINRAKIASLLFDKLGENKEFDATNLICTALVTQDIKNISTYITYVKEHNIEVDFNKIFDVFLFLGLYRYENVTDTVLEFIETYSKNPLEAKKELFNIYLEKKIKRHGRAFALNYFSSKLLNSISIDDRKDIIVIPYVRDVETAKTLIDLGFDINQRNEKGKNILFGLLCDIVYPNNMSDSKKELFKYLTDVNPETNERLIDIKHRDNDNKNALFYALQRFDTKDEYQYGSKERVYTYTEYEGFLADYIDMLPKSEVNNRDVIKVLEERMTEYFSDFGEKIHADFVYQHHKKLMEALRRKMTFTNKIYNEIFNELYPSDARSREVLHSRVQVEPSLDFLYETLDKNTKIQKLSIDNKYAKYMKCLEDNKISFEEFLCIFKKLIADLDELKLFYEHNITKRYNQEKYLEYVKNKYNVSYKDLSSYILKMIICGLIKFGGDTLPTILELCPGYDINTVMYEEPIDMSYYTYEAAVTVDHYNEDRYPAEYIDTDCHENIIFTGSLIHYGILINDIKLVEYLKSIGAKAKLMIGDEDRTWDYVSSYVMADLIALEVGPREVAEFNDEERKYLLDLPSLTNKDDN